MSSLPEHGGALQAGRAGSDDRERRCRRWLPGGSARDASHGGTPRRWSGSACTDRHGPDLPREMQTLQPMHSRIWSTRPSAIFDGRNGSAIDGRAAPMKSHWPPRIASAIRSGSVKRPTLTTGLEVTDFATRLYSASWLVAKKRDWAGILTPVDGADVDVPVVDERIEQGHDCLALPGRPDAAITEPERFLEGVDREAEADRAVVDRLPRLLEDLAQEAAAVLERPAVLIRPPVVERVEEVRGQRRDAAVVADQVEPRGAAPDGGVDAGRAACGGAHASSCPGA